MNKKSILLTGATGFIGSHLLRRLIKDDYDVIVVKRSFSNTHRIDDLLHRAHTYDIDKTELETIFLNHEIDTIIHLATFYNKEDKYSEIDETVSSNIAFPVKLLHLADKFNVKKFINTGTFFEEYLKNNYSLSKIAFAEFLRDWSKKDNNRALTLVLYHPYGPKDNDKIIPFIIKNILNNTEFSIKSLYQKLNLTYIDDIIEAYVSAIKYVENIYLYEKIFLYKLVDVNIEKVLMEVEEILDKKANLISCKNSDSILEYKTPFNYTRFKWKPKHSLREGLEKTIKYYKGESL